MPLRSNKEMDARIREIARREQARRPGYSNGIRVRFVEPSPRPKPAPKPAPKLPAPVPTVERVGKPKAAKMPKPRLARHRVAMAPPDNTRRGRILEYLKANGPSTAPALAKALGEEPGPVNVALLKMAKRGFTERTGNKIPSPNSRPHTEWRATEKST